VITRIQGYLDQQNQGKTKAFFVFLAATSGSDEPEGRLFVIPSCPGYLGNPNQGKYQDTWEYSLVLLLIPMS
jgi:hypothetical protein